MLDQVASDEVVLTSCRRWTGRILSGAADSNRSWFRERSRNRSRTCRNQVLQSGSVRLISSALNASWPCRSDIARPYYPVLHDAW